MTPAGRRALWIGAALLLLAAVGGREKNAAHGFADAVDDRSLELRIDLNSAGTAELESIAGIGPALAARIEGHRRRQGPFQRIDDLAAVPGIGPVTVGALAPFLNLGEGKTVSATGE